MDRSMKRREFIKVAAAGAMGAVASACAPQTVEVIRTVEVEKEVEKEVIKTVEVEKEVEKIVEVEVPQGFSDPPMLASRVASGELPPVAERLPENPLVVSGREAIGDYGGEIRMSHFDVIWMVSNYDLNAERMLHYSDFDNKTIVPNIMESWEVNDDGTEWTFVMRRGMKWSDGEPFTTEDVRFWWEDVLLNPDIGGVGWQLRFGGENANFEFIDDTTFKMTFVRSFGNFAAHMTRWHTNGDFALPAHYLKQFHADYADADALAAMATELSVEGWAQVFNNKRQWGNGIWQGPANVTEIPSLSPWLVVDNPSDGLYLWERNPFYWKVDQAGNQLPYVDNLRYDFVQTIDANKLKIIQSELDIVGMHDVTINDYPYYKENEEASNYVVGDYLSCMSDRYILFPQFYLAEDPVLTEIVNDPRFVQALSVAIDREEVNESLFYGLARVGQTGPMPMSKYYKSRYGTIWAEYDPDLANQLLDEMGLDQRDSEGFRLRPDGQRLSYLIEHAGARVGPSTGKYTEMVVTYWREIGIDATTKEVQESLYNERLNNGQVQCGVWHQDRVTDMLLHIEWRWFIPVNSSQGGASSVWARWYNAADKTAADLVEPPDYIKQLYEWHDKVAEVVSEDERVDYGQKIFDFLTEQPLAIGLILESPAPLLFNKNLRNLPRPKAPIGWDSYGLSTYHPEAFFYVEGVRA